MHLFGHVSLLIPGQYHLQIENAQLEDDASYECQASRSESSQAIISSTAWVNVLSERKHGLCDGGRAGGCLALHACMLCICNFCFPGGNNHGPIHPTYQ